VAQTLEFHQLDCRLEHLRVRHPARFRQLLASLAEAGQQTPIIVIPSAQNYLVIDGHQRIAALKQLRRDTVEALVLDSMSEAEALLLVHSLRSRGEPETALEQGWLLAEMEEKHGYTLEELARRFNRSATWVARRLALVDTLPEAVQQQVAKAVLPRRLPCGIWLQWRASTWNIACGWGKSSPNSTGPRGKPRCSTTPGAMPKARRGVSGSWRNPSCF